MMWTTAALAALASTTGALAGMAPRRDSLAREPIAARASTCNGDASLCAKKYSNVTFVGAHNSYAIGNTVAAEQIWNVTQQLDAGVRMLQAQTHNSNSSGSGIQLCHTSCSLLDGGTLESWLGDVKSWSDAHPTEVLSLLMVNTENISPSKFATAFNSSGVTPLVYHPPGSVNSKDQWPTLGSMVDAKTTIVAYLSAGADQTVPWLLSEFDVMWESPYDQTTMPFNCSIDRKGAGATTSDQLYLVNHFKDQSIAGILAPDKASAPTVNTQANVQQTADSCAAGAGNGAYPNFILIDFVGEGNSSAWQGPFQAAAQMNGVKYSTPAVANVSSSSSSSSSPSPAASQSASSALPRTAGAAGLLGLTVAFTVGCTLLV